VARSSDGANSSASAALRAGPAGSGSASIGAWPIRASVALIRPSALAGRFAIRNATDSGARHRTSGMNISEQKAPNTKTAGHG